MHDLHDSWTLPSVSKKRADIIFADSDTSIGLRVSQMPRSSKLAFFVLTTTDDDDDDRRRRRRQTTDRTNYFTPCACTRGNNNK